MSPLAFSIRADLFRIVARFAAREAFVLDYNPALAGVRIEPSAQGGATISATNGLVALFVRDPQGRASRPATMQRPEQALAIMRDVARGRFGIDAQPQKPARVNFSDGHCVIDQAPALDVLISELGGAYPDFRPHVPPAGFRAAHALSADAGELLATAARQLARAAGQDEDLSHSARYALYRAANVDNERLIAVFPAWPEAFALIAPDGAEQPVAPHAWAPPSWLDAPTRVAERIA